MYTQTLYELSQEAERLLQLSRQQLQLLEKMPLSVPGDDAPQLALPWSQPNIAERHAMLNNELRKISRLEMVLAIVGTMKAGKSTTINAIVGTEVLPNRNRPMTALPTLIRHTPGQKEPVLHFSHVAPIDCLIQQLQQRLRDCDIKHLTDVLEIDKDMRALMQRIENGVAFEKYYLGAQPIFHCLKSLNDLVRLAKALDVDFPFSAYAAIEHIPVIEVEFVHLAGLESYPGQLTLLDTPGPNEAGQPHLQKMLNQQLARASAVLAVLVKHRRATFHLQIFNDGNAVAVSQQIAVSIFNDQLVAFLCRFCVVPFVGTFRADVHAVIFVGVFGVAFWAVW